MDSPQGDKIKTQPSLFGLGGKKYEWIPFHLVDLPLEMELFWRPFFFMGMGIYGFINFNTKKIISGARLCLQIGKIRQISTARDNATRLQQTISWSDLHF
jgi:hypothetical protein